MCNYSDKVSSWALEKSLKNRNQFINDKSAKTSNPIQSLRTTKSGQFQYGAIKRKSTNKNNNFINYQVMSETFFPSSFIFFLLLPDLLN